jgi:hypothetical protein
MEMLGFNIQLMQERKVVDPKLTNTSDSKYSVQALSLLAEVCMCIIDFLLELLLDSLVKGYATFILSILIFHILSNSTIKVKFIFYTRHIFPIASLREVKMCYGNVGIYAACSDNFNLPLTNNRCFLIQ